MTKRRRKNRRANRRHVIEKLESRHLLAANPFGTNPLQALDVNRDGNVSALDALRIINALGRSGSSNADPAANIGSFIDVTGDGQGTALDALRVINALGREAPLIAATLPSDSGPNGRPELGFDLLTNNYAIDLNVSLSELGDRTVQMRIGNDTVFADITDRFVDRTASLTVAEIDSLFGNPLPDGDHPIEVQIGEDGSSISFVLTVDREAPAPRPTVGEIVRVATDFLDIDFGETVATSGIDVDAFSLAEVGGSPVTIVEATVLASQIRLRFEGVLADAEFQIDFNGPVEDLAGNVAQSSSDRFTVADPPGIESISPSNGERQVNVTRETIVQFDEPIDPSSVTPNSFLVMAAGSPVPGSIRVNRTGRSATFFYTDPLPASTQIEVILDTQAIRDTGGLLLDGDGNDEPGGLSETTFRTLPLTLIPNTVVEGFVRDSQTRLPIAEVVIALAALPGIQATTDADGYFELGIQDTNGDGVADGLPAPDFFVFIDGSGANSPDGSAYAQLGKPFHSVPGQRTQLEADNDVFDIYLPPIPNGAPVPIIPGQETILGFGEDSLADLAEMMPDVDPQLFQQLRITIPADAAINDQGEQATQAFVVPVDPDFLPAPLPTNLNPALVVSVQAPGTANFDVPVPIAFPNLEGLTPGEKTLLFSFNHDAGRFEVNGTATVSEDGLSVVTDPGVGIEAPGWHFNQSGSQTRINVHKCLSDLGSGSGQVAQDIGLLGSNAHLTYLSAVEKNPLTKRGLGLFSVGFNIASVASQIGSTDYRDGVNDQLEFAETMFSGLTALLSIGSLIPGAGIGFRIATFVSGSISTAISLKLAANRAEQIGDLFDAGGSCSSSTASRGRGNGEQIRNPIANDLRNGASLLNSIIGGATSGQEADGRVAEELARAFSPWLNDHLVRNLGLPTDAVTITLGPGNSVVVRNMDDEALTLDLTTNQPFDLTLNDLVPPIPSREQLDKTAMILKSDVFNRAFDELAELDSDGNRTAWVESIESAFGLFGKATEQASQDVGEEVYYRIESGNLTLRGRGNPTSISVVLPENSVYRIFVTDLVGQTFGASGGITEASGRSTRIQLPPVLVQDQSLDTDLDGLSDQVEAILGTRLDLSDSDGDGINDQQELLQGLDPLGGRAFPTGSIANLDLQGQADEIIVRAVDGDVAQAAFVATGSFGLAIADVSQFDNPILLAELDLPGDSIDLGLDRRQEIIAIAARSGGLHLVDVSELDQPRLIQTVGDRTDQVAVRDGVVYAIGEQAVRRYSIADGTLLDAIDLGRRVDDIVVSREGVFVLTSLELIAFQESAVGLTEIDRIAVSGSASPQTAGRRLHIDDDVAYVGTFTGFTTIDVSDPASLSILGTPPTTQEAVHNLATNGSGLVLPITSFAGPGTLALAQYNGRDPADVTAFQTRFDTPGTARSVAIASGIAFVADGSAGLTVVNYLPFDSAGNPPTVEANLQNSDFDPAASGLQLLEGSFVDFDIRITDDIQVQRVELLLNGQIVSSSIAVPFDLSTQIDILTKGTTERTVQLQVRAVDTGGNETLTDSIEIQIVPDTIAPMVLAVSPANNATRLEGFTVAIVTFSEPVQIDNLPADAIRLIAQSDLQLILPERFVQRGTGQEILAVFPSLEIDEYELLVDEVFRDFSGNILADSVSSNFSVIANTDPGETFGDALDLGELIGSDAITGTIGIDDVNGDPDPVDVFRFSVSDFRDLELSLTGRTDGSRIFLARDIHANGVFDDGETWVSDSTFGTADVGFTTSISPGEYCIWIDGARSDDATTYVLDYAVTEHVRGPIDLISGETRQQRIATLGEFDFYTIDATAGSRLFLNYTEQTRVLRAGVFVYAPDGSLLSSVDNVDSASFADLELTATGLYTIVLREFGGDATGDYSLTAVVVDDTTDADNVELTSGLTISGMLEAGDIDTFTIDATAGSRLFLNYTEQTRVLRAGVFVYAPDGSLLSSVDNVDDASFADLELTATGLYTIVLREFGGDATGDYALTAVVVDSTTDADNVELTSGLTISGMLEAGDIDTFTIDATAGSRLFLNYTEQTSVLRAGVFIYAPDGSLLSSVDNVDDASFADLELTATGLYTIVLREFGGDATGDYALTAVVVDSTTDADNVELTSGLTISGMLEAGDIDTFTIDAIAGSRLFLNYTEQTSVLRAGIFIYAPDGSLVSSVDNVDDASLTDLELTATGLYTIVLREFGGDATGDYSLTAVVVDSTTDADNVELTSGLTISGMLEAGDIDTFTIDTTAGSRMFLNYTEQTSVLRAGVFIYTPDGSLLSSVDNVDDASFTDLELTATGLYTIVLREFGGDAVGDYQLTATIG